MVLSKFLVYDNELSATEYARVYKFLHLCCEVGVFCLLTDKDLVLLLTEIVQVIRLSCIDGTCNFEFLFISAACKL